MATATMSRDDDISPTSHARDISPHPATQDWENGDTMKPTNGYVHSPLRSSQRVSSVITDKDLPDVPREEPRDDAPQANGGQSSFPIQAKSGSLGVPPTTNSPPNGYVRSKKSSGGSGTDTPPRRRSVQFARETEEMEPGSLTTTTTWEDEEHTEEAPARERQASFFGKLRALNPMASTSSSSHMRTTSNLTASGSPGTALSPSSERSEPSYPVEPSEDAEADLEEEASEDIETPRPKKTRRKSRRPPIHVSETSPSTPKTPRFESRFASFIREHRGAATNEDSQNASALPAGSLHRRNTTSDTSDNARAGLSEDEGRDRVRSAWRKGIEGARGLRKPQNENESPDARRPSQMRRLTGMGSSQTDGTATASPFRARADRQTSSSAQKWRQVKAGLKMLGQRRRDERMRVDHQKSAQLMAELLAGAPAALVLGSMFQRDENNHRKIPVLMEQLKIRIVDSQIREQKSGDRHLVFKIDLEYGNGQARMRWTINRSLKDFVNLHAKYQAQMAAYKVRHLRTDNRNRAKMPRFPRSAFPYARNFRGLFDNLADEEDEEDEMPPTPGAAILHDVMESPVTPGAVQTPLVPGGRFTPTQLEFSPITPGPSTSLAPPKHKRQKSSVFLPSALRRTSTGGEMGPLPENPEELNERQRELYQRRQRRKLETYLQQMIRWLMFRADSTRLCKFLELSALAIRLSAEGGYQGKQGLLTIASRRNREMRRKPLGPQALVERHHPRWFLVRHSYIVCVDGPESLNPYDVFLVDSDFRTEKKKRSEQTSVEDVAKDVAEKAATLGHTKHLILRLYNSERKLKLLARTERQYLQFQESLNMMAEATVWSKKQRFASYAPVRNNVWARWLVDGRDHMWQVSRAIDNAKDFVYIHDWWLSPELYMRRPAAISQKWRLDRLLQRKAQEGVKIFVIVYRNIESAIPIDSEYTKWSLLDLHENICIQRSPNQFRQNQFFWAHHEKLVVVDNMMAFVGGVDLCFGRWDDPCHSLTDDKLTGFELDHVGPRDSEHCQVWPGKDYSNPRVQDFYALDRPYEEMYDRTKVPRMPWHDITMQMVGQPARDVGRHFIQRWNYILRSRIPSRPTPILMPPPEYEQLELEALGMTGSCQVQILRSCAPWSIGTPNKVELSIMNAYVHLIEHSQHFVYLENQFYISSCTVEGTPIHNKIGDALVERIIRAAENEETWQACILIPLMPGFQNSVDSQDGTSIRLIMQCQYRSICRGDTSIFGRVRAHGIDPEDYIRFYSLRQWGKIGSEKILTTEQLYIHAKCMVVDDRSVIIGSANINERSMLGSRDSEVAAVVTDMKMIPSLMGGEDYEVGEFAHTLRKRLMREHLGIDVDVIYRREQTTREREQQDAEMARIYRDDSEEAYDYFSQPTSPPLTPQPGGLAANRNVEASSAGNTSNGLAGTTRVGSSASLEQPTIEQLDKTCKRPTAELKAHDLDVDGYGFDNMRALVEAGDFGLNDSFVDEHGREVLLKKDAPDAERIRSLDDSEEPGRSSAEQKDEKMSFRPPYPTERMDTYELGLAPRSQLPELPALDDTDIGGPPLNRGASLSSTKPANPLAHILRRPEVHEDCMTDPIATGFYHDIWNQVAENNTRIYRQVFRCMPDSEVKDWKAYNAFNEYNERFMQSQGLGSSKPKPPKDAPGMSGPPGSGRSDSISNISIAEQADGGRPRSKSVLSGMMSKLRSGSKTSDEPRHTEQMREKQNTPEATSRSPDSPHSGQSGGATASPSPQPDPLDEKEAQKAADRIEQKDYALPPVDEEKEALSQQDSARTRRRTVNYTNDVNAAPETTATQSATSAEAQQPGTQKRRRRGTTKSSARTVPDEPMGRDEAEGLLKLVQGHLVQWSYDWLEKEERNGNWLYNIDQLAPIEIYD